MSNIAKKVTSVGLSVTTAVWLSGAALVMPVVSHAQVDIATLQAQIQSLMAQLAALQGQQSTVAAYNFTRNLTVGSRGEDVTALQNFLKSQSSAQWPTAQAATGYFGAKTKSALANYQRAQGISPAVGYFGAITRAKVTSAMASTPTGPTTPTTPTTPTPTSGAFGLAVDNPTMMTIPQGATGVTFLKFNVSGNGTVDSLTFKRTGIGATGDFNSSGVYLYEGNTRLTSGRSINSTTHEISFLNLGLSVSGSRTFSLVADVSTSATAGNQNMIELTGATGSLTLGSPLRGNMMTIGGQDVGTITATSGAAPVNPKVGEQGALLAEFTLAAGSTEDIRITQIAATEGGSISNSNLSNFKLKQNDVVIATAGSVGAKDLISFVLTTPFTLEKGQSRNFKIYGDIAGTTRSDDTIVLYFDSSADIRATGVTYGYTVTPTITGLDTTSEGDTLTVQGGQLTISTNGPVAGDLALRGQDLTVLNFSIAAQNNVEIRNLRLHATTTGLISGEGFTDFKVWDTASNAVLTSASDVTTSTDVTFTDVINLSAGQSRSFKITVDVDADNDDGDDITVSLLAFSAGDVRNLDNNTNVALASIVPNATISGNVQDTRVPTADVQLSSTPTSQTLVRGTQSVPLLGFSLRATGGDVKLSSVRVTASASTGTLVSSEIQSLGLYDGTTLISDLKSLDATNLNATFSGLNVTITKGSTKVLTVKGNIDSNATDTDVYFVYLASAGSSDLTVYDVDGNTATLSGTAANSGGSVAMTITTTGAVTVARAADDVDSEAGIMIAGREEVLGKFKFTATNEAMTLNDMQILVVPTNSATATSSASADEVPTIKLYDGSTQIGSVSGYSVTGSGDNSGVAYVTDLGFVIPKDGNKTITVKGVLNTTSAGADSGASVYASVMATGFEAQGATALDTTITAATSNQKVVFKTKPTISTTALTQPTKLNNGLTAAMRFRVTADTTADVSWKKISMYVTMNGATMTAVDAVPSTTSGNITIVDMANPGTNLNISSAFSGNAVASTSQATITGGNNGYVTLILSSEQIIAAGQSRDYEVKLNFSSSDATGDSSAINLHRTESSVSTGSVTGLEGTLDGSPSFMWSDNSSTSHAESTSDWANGFLLKTIPSSPTQLNY